MKKITLISLIALFAFEVMHAQNNNSGSNFDPAVITNGYYNTGIYYTINQFWANSPENTFPIKLENRSKFRSVLLYYNSQTNRFEHYTRPNWGVCIDNQIFLHIGNGYIMIQPTGRFSFFIKDRLRLQEAGVPYVVTYSKIKSAHKEFIFDFKTNMTYRLNVFNVESILKSEDIDLYNEFISSRNKKYLLKDYIQKLNGK
jgi:hypothetical protein